MFLKSGMKDRSVMKKALHISPNVYESVSSAGGTKRIWEELSKNYDEYHVFARSKDNNCHIDRMGKIILHTIPNILNKTYPFFLTSYHYLKKLLKTEKFDIVICQCSIFGGYSAIKLLKGKTPILMEMHGYFYFDILEGEGVKNKVLSHIIRYSFKHCNAIRTLNVDMSSKMNRLNIYSEHMYVVENRVSLEVFNRPKDNQVIAEKVTLISIGNFVECKGHRYALQSLKELKERYDISLILVSGGELKSEYEHFAKQHDLEVKLIEKCTQEELVCIMRQADIYIHTSNREGMPRVILEAMAMKLPVISSKAGFIEGTITHNYNGLLTEIGDVAGLVDAIEYLINSEDERIRLAENAYKDVLERFEWNKCFEQYRALLEKVENL